MRWTAGSSNFALRHLIVGTMTIFCLTAFSQFAFAYNYQGRASIGAFNGKEKYKGDKGEGFDEYNKTFDVRTISTRLYYEGTDFWDPGADNQFVADLRDKHDFFDKNNKESLELESQNDFQIRTLSLRTRPEGENISYQIGRFAIPFAGSVFTDGAHVAYRRDEKSLIGVFGGYNPRQIDRSYLKFDEKARDFGAYYHYEIKYPTWERRFLADQAIVRETLENEPVRMYVYQNTYYQWKSENYVSSLLYLDFEPKFYVQNASVGGQRVWHRFTGNAGILILDTVEYNRRQDILEDLDPSPYSEMNLGGRYKVTDKSMPYLKLRYGKRDADNLDRTHMILGLDLPQYFSNFIDFYSQLAYKEDFTRKGTYVKIGAGYYRSIWQTDVSVETGTEKASDGESHTPVIFDVDTGRSFNRQFFGAFGLQVAQNDEVDAFALFFKLTYKFGQTRVAPMRDQAPSRGSLLMKKLAPFLTLLLAFSALAQTTGGTKEGIFNKLFGPGPLIEGHADLENGDCLKCHDTGGRGVPDSKCLDCHKEIRVSVEKKTGFHGLAKGTCIQCHSDHKGREYDSTKVDQKTFDHNKTGYKLTGEHAKLKCTDCHKETRAKKPIRRTETRFFGKQAQCISCHKKDDVHFFKDQFAKKDCNACHNEDSWKKDIQFDHTRDTKFELIGSHKQLDCAECHITDEKTKASTYKWPDLKKNDCRSCHEDVHGKNLSPKYQNGQCLTCHAKDQVEWKIPKFNHDVTNYKLRGKHAELKCTECHKQDPARLTQSTKLYKWSGLRSDCLSCHKDFHVFGNGSPKPNLKKFKSLNQCLNCHNEKDWAATHDFNHDKDTRYTITGRHKTVSCQECHVTPAAKSPTKRAVGQYHWAQLDAKTCETCHASPHKDSFSKEFTTKKCSECHVTDDWFKKPGGASFNHDETRFKLTGRHLSIDCAKCHTGTGKDKIYKFKSFDKQFCVDCHSTPHKDQFNQKYVEQACSTCHTTKDFSTRLKFDHDKTKFKIEGAHTELQCNDCHTETKKGEYEKRPVTWHKFLFKDLDEKACKTCHADYHDGQLSGKCTDCHTQKTWKGPTFDHNKQSKFKLNGKHQDLKCSECHVPAKNAKTIQFGPKKQTYKIVKYKPLATDCNSCHKTDDVHKGEFGADCNRCHVEKGWKITKDFHKNFALKGQHFTLNCNECHVDDRRLSGTGQNCVFCHQKDDVHRGTLPNCNDCHRQQLWEQTKFRHVMVYPLRGAHATLDCFECHKQGVYAGTPTSCVSCHASQARAAATHDFSPGGDEEKCVTCHIKAPYTWDF